ncbi:hypothetical protein FA95DRAFT_1529623 [Auriscalpium vulgare]|uniref:Uncharacterized protein n=1 Tax=Auriscalpium vulgare TaxID=40419 RepID=A0ACB8SBJ6_9AGAM|nr:hypothetical protein FA95DRAFT_1529623 [Auriscalpium vulgare]
MVSVAAAITDSEFVTMLSRCRPPGGWPSRLAVAFSGGADSTCLLFLLQRVISSREHHKGILPRAMIAINVNHGLQSSSNDMSKRARGIAKAIGVHTHEHRIAWANPPFPPRPSAGDAVEGVARAARYRALFDEMTDVGASVVAFGHHADDQVETALMRLTRGSTELGLAGMRPIRRWGMGFGAEEGGLGSFGHEGMKRWIVRPLLRVSKDRILATCAENKLEYVTDKSNFEPDLTVRNAIRHLLARPDASKLPLDELRAWPSAVAAQFAEMKKSADSLDMPIPLDITSSPEELRGAVTWAAQRLDDVENNATVALSRHSVQSPPSTFLLATDKLRAVTDPMVRMTMVLRILRYISPSPWGSVASQAGRRVASLQRVIERLWNSDPSSPDRAAFEAGARVLWTPARICADGRLKRLAPRPGERFGWIASRARPEKLLPTATELDITDVLREGLRDTQTPGAKVEVIYDNRFLLTFRPPSMPGEVSKSLLGGTGRVVVVAEAKWFWPKVIWQRAGQEDAVLARISMPEMVWYQRFEAVKEVVRSKNAPTEEPLWEEGVSIDFIRTLDEV